MVSVIQLTFMCYNFFFSPDILVKRKKAVFCKRKIWSLYNFLATPLINNDRTATQGVDCYILRLLIFIH